MNWSHVALGFLVGFGFASLLYWLVWRGGREARRLMSMEFMKQAEDRFKVLSGEVLRESGRHLETSARKLMESERQLAVKDLEQQKAIVSERMDNVNAALAQAVELMQNLQKDRAQKFGQLSGELKGLSEQARTLGEGTARLNSLLSASQSRGQWGERMAGDVLRAAGMLENINYLVQHSDGQRGRPDFTFLLPEDKRLNMDVKFPLDNYRQYLDSQDEETGRRHLAQFFRDVRSRTKELTRREYISPEEGTLDFVLMFIPNEGLFRLIMEQDPEMFDYALGHKVLLCSPFSLFALLGIVRQSLQTFALQEKSAEILKLLSAFRKQWDKFLDKLEMLGRRIDDTQKAYNELTTTRKNQLERQLDRIDRVQLPNLSTDEEE